MEKEVTLPGGNVSGAVRAGATVRRATGPWTPAVHGLLDHLNGAGLTGVPRVHGYDERGREVLDYLPGTAYGPEVPDDVLADAMRWLARYHEVVASYRPAGVIRLKAAPSLAQRSARVIRDGQLAGDPGMLNLANVGEPDRTERRLRVLRERLPEIAAHL